MPGGQPEVRKCPTPGTGNIRKCPGVAWGGGGGGWTLLELTDALDLLHLEDPVLLFRHGGPCKFKFVKNLVGWLRFSAFDCNGRLELGNPANGKEISDILFRSEKEEYP